MKTINLLAVVDLERCDHCRVCERVCPVLAINVTRKKVKIKEEKCRGCGACEQRCPQQAISMQRLDKSYQVGIDVNEVDYSRVEEICRAAKFHPEQIVCYCTSTRADEVAAAIVKGASSPEEVSLHTGARTGCKVECIQPILRLLEASGIYPNPPSDGWQWYGRTMTVWEIPDSIKQKYANRGFSFDEDIELLERVVKAPKQGRRES